MLDDPRAPPELLGLGASQQPEQVLASRLGTAGEAWAANGIMMHERAARHIGDHEPINHQPVIQSVKSVEDIAGYWAGRRAGASQLLTGFSRSHTGRRGSNGRPLQDE